MSLHCVWLLPVLTMPTGQLNQNFLLCTPWIPDPQKRGLGVTFPAPESHNTAETKPLGAAPCSPGEPINK